MNASGPWTDDHVFTERDAGVPLDLAPLWQVTARHDVEGLAEREGSWSARVEAEKLGGDGRPWWREVRELTPIEGMGAAAVAIDVGALMEDAKAKDAVVRTPGRLDVRIVFVHDAEVLVRGEAQAVSRTAWLLLQAGEAYVSVVPTADGGSWSQAGARPVPWIAAGALALALAIEPAARRVRAGEPAWKRARGVTVVEVADARPPHDAARCDLPSALRAAKETGAAVLIDRRRGVAVVKGAVTLVAALAPEKAFFEVVRPVARPAPEPRPGARPEPKPGPEPDRAIRHEELSLSQVFGTIPSTGEEAEDAPAPGVPPAGTPPGRSAPRKRHDGGAPPPR